MANIKYLRQELSPLLFRVIPQEVSGRLTPPQELKNQRPSPIGKLHFIVWSKMYKLDQAYAVIRSMRKSSVPEVQGATKTRFFGCPFTKYMSQFQFLHILVLQNFGLCCNKFADFQGRRSSEIENIISLTVLENTFSTFHNPHINWSERYYRQWETYFRGYILSIYIYADCVRNGVQFSQGAKEKHLQNIFSLRIGGGGFLTCLLRVRHQGGGF